MKPNVFFLATLGLANASSRTTSFVEFGHTFREQSSVSLAKATKKLAYQAGEATKSTKRAPKLFKSKGGGEYADSYSAKTIVLSKSSRVSGKPKSIAKSSKHIKSVGNAWSKAAKSAKSSLPADIIIGSISMSYDLTDSSDGQKLAAGAVDSNMSYSLHASSSEKSSKSTGWYEFEPRVVDSSMSYALSADQLSMNYLSMNSDRSPSYASKSSKGAASSMSFVYTQDIIKEDSNDDSNGSGLAASNTQPSTSDSAVTTQIGQPEEESAIQQDVFGKIM